MLPASWTQTPLGHSEAAEQSGKEPGHWRPDEFQVLPLSCVILGKLLKVSVTELSHL